MWPTDNAYFNLVWAMVRQSEAAPPRRQTCPECEGRGEVLDAPAYGDAHAYWTVCLECKGTGVTPTAS